ncbi:MAG TPA: SRPBCC domain-containing protein [Jatrophihabitans sp.]|nr:SRPBCC domain-containing protein [Jatrophihabitans sp.]
MQLEHTFTVPADVEQAWQVLLDIERIAPCMPGAALDSVDGDHFTGTVKVRLGPIGLTYKGKASFVEKDATAHRVVINAQGKDARGNGTATATVTATLSEQGSETRVVVHTDLNITGKPAQFGRGVMVDVGNKLIGQFADCLAGKLSGDAEPEPATEPAAVSEPETVTEPAVPAEPAAVTEPAPSEPAPRQPAHAAPAAEVQPIDLLGSAGPAIAKRLVPVAVVVLILLLILRRRRR